MRGDHTQYISRSGYENRALALILSLSLSLRTHVLNCRGLGFSEDSAVKWALSQHQFEVLIVRITAAAGVGILQRVIKRD